MDKEKDEQNKIERVNKIKDYLVLFQWIDKSLNSEFEKIEISTIDFARIYDSLDKEKEGKNE